MNMPHRNKRFGYQLLAGSTVAITFLGLGCFFLWSDSYYSVDKFANFTAQSLPGRNTILVRGHLMGSGYCVGKIDYQEGGGELNLRMRYRIVCPNQRNGDFSVEIPASTTTHRVTYGKERVELLYKVQYSVTRDRTL